MLSWPAKKLLTYVMAKTREGDIRPTLMLDAPDLIFTFPGDNSWSGTITGRDGHRRWLERSPENRLKLPRLKTGDASFDQKFSVHGPAPISDPELRHRLARQQGDGVLTIWNGRAARYVLSNPAVLDEAPALFAGKLDGDPPVGTAVSLLDTLADLIEASTPAESDSES